LNSCEKSEPESSTSDRDAFIGQFASESTGAGGNRNFVMTITASSSAPDQIKMANFDGDPNVIIFATVSGTSLAISSQSISGETYQGTGNLSNSKNLTINFSVDDGQTVENRVLTGVKN
jgi:hypothetical protein